MHIRNWASYVLLGQAAVVLAAPQAATETPEITAAPTSTALPPSPTGSDCSPHGDHWHCHSLASATEEPAIHDDGVTVAVPDGVSEPTSPPGKSEESPMATCTPHGDHWHCPEGVPEPSTAPAGADHNRDNDHDREDDDDAFDDDFDGDDEDDHDHDAHDHDAHDHDAHDDDDDEKECQPHGDHWHCPAGVDQPHYPPNGTTTSVNKATGEPTSAKSSAPSSTGTTVPANAGAKDTATFGVAASVLGSVLFGVFLL